jgi:hypothetical protein
MEKITNSDKKGKVKIKKERNGDGRGIKPSSSQCLGTLFPVPKKRSY